VTVLNSILQSSFINISADPRPIPSSDKISCTIELEKSKELEERMKEAKDVFAT